MGSEQVKSAALGNVGVGTVLVGRYLLAEPVDHTEHSTVWRANDEELDRPVRVTLLAGGNTDFVLDAARQAALVTDPRVARVLDVGVTEIPDADGAPTEVAYLVNEPLPGLSLAEAVSQRPLTPTQARAVVGEVAEALDAAHRRGVRHLALRPEEVRLVGDRVHLTGLGVSHALSGAATSESAASAADTRGLIALAHYATSGEWLGKGVPEPDPIRLEQLGPLQPLFADAAPETPGQVAAALGAWDVTQDLTGVVRRIPITFPATAPLPPAVPVRQSVRGRRGNAPVRRSGRIARHSGKHALAPRPTTVAADAATAPFRAIPPSSVVPSGAIPVVATAAAVPMRPTRPARQPRGLNPTPIALLLALAGLGAGSYWAVGNVIEMFAPGSPIAVEVAPEPTAPPDESAGETATPEPEPTPEEVRPVIVSATSVDGERAELAHLAVDGDPQTFWYTFTYHTAAFGGLKDGTGLFLQLAEPAPVNSITILTTGSGGNVEIRATAAATPTEGPVLASGPLDGGATEFDFAESVVSDQFVLWFTELPAVPDGRFRLEVQEVMMH